MGVLTRSEAKTHLDIAQTVTAHDLELDSFIAAAEAAVEARVGPLTSSSGHAVRVAGGGRALVLPTGSPVVSVESVTPVGGTALDVADLRLNKLARLVEMTDGGPFASAQYDVVYTAGRTDVPADLLMAVKEVLRHMWMTQRRASGGRIGGDESAANTLPGSAYLFPFRVEQLLRPYARTGVA